MKLLMHSQGILNRIVGKSPSLPIFAVVSPQRDTFPLPPFFR